MITNTEYLSKIQEIYGENILNESPSNNYISIDIEGYISSWNTKAEQVFGWKESEVLSKKIIEVLNSEILDFAKKSFTNTLHNQKISDFFELHDKFDNELLVYISFSRLIDTKKHLIGYILECKDITEKNYFVNQLKKKKDELSILSHRLFHDLRNSLLNIENSAQFMKLNNTFTFEHYKRLDSILMNVNVIKILLQKSIYLANTGTIIDKKSPSNIGKIIDETVKIVDPTFNFGIGKFPVILADGQILFHVFKNILENNLIHGSPNIISIKGQYKSNIYQILISNDGIPIPHDTIDEILSNQTSGLGMKVVNRILQAHSWQLKILSEQKNTFIIEIPLNDIIE
jgi:PAS domain S-box-containing protein